MKKTFVLDTNVLLHNADSIKSFKDNYVILPMSVIEELDNFKNRTDELGRNARHVIRTLDELRQKGNLREGVETEHGGIVKIITGKGTIRDAELDMDIPDNRIIRVAYKLSKKNEQVIFVSKDINARLKADALGLKVQDFEKQKVNYDELYQGFKTEIVDVDIIESFQEFESVKIDSIKSEPNEFVFLKTEDKEGEDNSKNPSILVRNIDGEGYTRLSEHSNHVWNIDAKNKEQRMALELLLDPKVELVTMIGKAGSGKTLLALAAGLELLNKKHSYDKILVSRPIIPLGKDIGYLPGDKDEKLSIWMQPIFDNLHFLMKDTQNNNEQQLVSQRVEKLFKSGLIEMEAITFIRGRSISRQFIIVDEAQNLTPHEIKTIISRAGEGTKVVLTGDPQQIDNPYLDSSSNGLSYTAERMKSLPLHGHITLQTGERSKLAAIAADIL